MTLRQKIEKQSARMKALVERYGSVAIAMWMALFTPVLAGSYAAISLGFDLGESVAGKTGVLAMAYGATMLTKPVRLVITLALTPLVAQLLQRRAGAEATEAPAEPVGR